jgi:cell division protease FtsH
MTAFHEAGHLVIMYLAHPTNDVFKASIVQRGGVLGVVHGVPREELYSNDRNTYWASIKVSLAGYVAEKFQFGVTTDGVSADFANAMNVAHSMVWKFGMGTNGFLGDFTSIPKEQISESLKEKLNLETQQILKQASAEVEATLKAEWPIVQRFAEELLKRDELDYDEIVSIFLEFGKPPRIAGGVHGGLASSNAPQLLEGQQQPSPTSKPPFA